MESNIEKITLNLRKLAEQGDSSGKFHQVENVTIWKPKETAAVICDMWDRHWCKGASARVAEMAMRMNELITALRSKGVVIIHAPSDTMEYYSCHPGRILMNNLKMASAGEVMPHIKRIKEGAFPIDDSDEGCWCVPKCEIGRPWTRQIDTIEISDNDFITDNDEIFYFFKDRSIKNVIVMGVHVNMCILGRPFGIRGLVGRDLNVVLVRDLTDTMYNPAMRPFVDHFTGTDLVVRYIEKYLCSTIASDQIIGGSEFRFREDKREKGPEYNEFIIA